MTTDSPRDGLPESIVMWEEDGIWVICHERTGVTTQGDSRLHALLMLADALSLHMEDETDVRELAEDVFTPDNEMLDLDEFSRE